MKNTVLNEKECEIIVNLMLACKNFLNIKWSIFTDEAFQLYLKLGGKIED